MIKLNSILTLLLLLLLSCSSIEKKEEKTESSLFSPNIDIIVAPWFVKIPVQANQIIGISKTSADLNDMYEAAKEMATIQYARNLSSYNINNTIGIQSEITVDGNDSYTSDDKRDWIFQISDAQQLKKIYNRLSLEDYFFVHNTYFVALFKLEAKENKDTAVNRIQFDKEVTDAVLLNSSLSPDWFTDKGVDVSNDFIYARVSTGSACLISAWEEAAKEARLILSTYFSTSVESLTQNTTIDDAERTKQAIAIETKYNLQNIETNRSYIQSRFLNNSIRYVVYLEMRIGS